MITNSRKIPSLLCWLLHNCHTILNKKCVSLDQIRSDRRANLFFNLFVTLIACDNVIKIDDWRASGDIYAHNSSWEMAKFFNTTVNFVHNSQIYGFRFHKGYAKSGSPIICNGQHYRRLSTTTCRTTYNHSTDVPRVWYFRWKRFKNVEDKSLSSL